MWDKSRVEQFNRIQPGRSGELPFEFRLVDDLQNAFVDLSVVMTAKSQDVGVPLVGEARRTVQLVSPVKFTAISLHAGGPLNNTGPFPPMVEEATTYTITWSITNPSNDLSGVRVSAALPDYVSWSDVVSPPAANIAFNPVGREVLWSPDVVLAGAGFSRAPEEVSFQVVLRPSVSQVGTAPVLVGDALLEGVDTFTNTPVRVSASEVNTAVSNDPGFQIGQSKVTN